MRLPVLLLLGGCIFEPPPSLPPLQDLEMEPPSPGPSDLGGDLILGSIELDTGAPDLWTLPAGSVQISPQLDASEAVVLEVRDLIVPKDAVVRVMGSRPLIVVASRDAIIAGLIDVSAHGAVPGPGGYPPGLGDAPGANGTSHADSVDLGGGGGGFGSAGGAGGGLGRDAGGSGGAIVAPLVSILRGGSGGGSGAAGNCNIASGGAGGGAIRIHATLIDIEGAVLAGGGGGAGGSYCYFADSAAGGGGGAGGTIHLDADRIHVSGSLAANGGGGGGAASGIVSTTELPGPGEPGEDGTIDFAAAGGISGGPRGTEGGPGSFDGDGSVGGSRTEPGNTGGGGGGGGRIILRARTMILEGSIVPLPSS